MRLSFSSKKNQGKDLDCGEKSEMKTRKLNELNNCVNGGWKIHEGWTSIQVRETVN